MDSKITFWTCLLCVVVSLWLYISLKQGDQRYWNHPHLFNATSGSFITPSSLVNYSRTLAWPRDYIDNSSSRSRFYDDNIFYSLMLPFTLDQVYSKDEQLKQSGWPVANSTLCSQQLAAIHKIIDMIPNYQALEGVLAKNLTFYMDTMGRPEAGLYTGGARHWLGSYDECLAASLNVDQESIRMRYCLGRYRMVSWPKKAPVNSEPSINIGLCLPETCDTQAYEQNKEAIDKLARYEMPDHYRQSIEISSLFCLPDERSPIRQMPFSGRLFIYILSGWTAFYLINSIVYGLLFRQKKNRGAHHLLPGASNKQPGQLAAKLVGVGTADAGRGGGGGGGASRNESQSLIIRLLEGLTFRHSLKHLQSVRFRVRHKDGEDVRVYTSAVDFFKCMMTILIVVAHSGLLAWIYMRTSRTQVELLDHPLAKLMAMIGPTIHVFFLFFGVLTGYSLLRKLSLDDLSKPLVWLGLNISTFIRLMPMISIAYWFSRSVAPYLGAGPWWDYGVDRLSLRGLCMNEAWLKSVPYLSHLGGGMSVSACNSPVWFISSYLKLLLLLPLITVIIAKLPNHLMRIVFVGGMMLVSLANNAHRLYYQQAVSMDAIKQFGSMLLILVDKYESSGYMDTLGRLGTVTIGIYAGFLAYKYDIGEIKRWPVWMRSKLTTCFVVLSLVLSSMHTVILSQLPERLLTKELFVVDEAIVSTVWMVMVPVLILQVHEHAPTFGYKSDGVKLAFTVSFLVILLSLVLYLVIEAPLEHLIMTLGEPILNQKKANKRESDRRERLLGEPTSQTPDGIRQASVV